MNIFCAERDEVIATFEQMEGIAFETSDLERQQKKLREEMNVVAEMVERYNDVQTKRNEVAASITQKQAQREMETVIVSVEISIPRKHQEQERCS